MELSALLRDGGKYVHQSHTRLDCLFKVATRERSGSGSRVAIPADLHVRSFRSIGHGEEEAEVEERRKERDVVGPVRRSYSIETGHAREASRIRRRGGVLARQETIEGTRRKERTSYLNRPFS